MIKNVTLVNLGKDDKITSPQWYTYEKICDSCGKKIEMLNQFRHSDAPNTSQEDLCYTCLINKGISFWANIKK